MNDQEQPPAVLAHPEAPPQQDPFTELLARADHQDANIQEIALALQRLYQNTSVPAPAPAAAPVDPPVPQVRCNFRLPAIKPLPFSGVFGNKPAHKIQNLIDDYLERSYEFCLLHRLAPSTAEISHPDQPTYVQFVTGGLSDAACSSWRLFPQHKRTHMTWEDYAEWVIMKFGSRLSLDQALDALDALFQTTSAAAYSAKFNNLVSSISVAGTDFSPKHICSRYHKNLKDHLKALTDLVKINDSLVLLQQQARYLDDIAFHSTGKSGCKNITVTTTSRTTSQSFQSPQGHTLKNSIPDTTNPMDLGNTQQQTSPRSSDPKDGAFIAQAKDHDTNHCPKLKNRQAQLTTKPATSVNHATTQAKGEEDSEDEE
ncbi:hypothetical protein HDU77_011060 [Chytriomyces hyalinus]|nr:hypothetical protein HDU77_011060 [Chytriomyces hyalinus]